jgi:hypothetical protein
MKGFVGKPNAAALARLEETELLVQVCQVLLHGALGDRQLGEMASVLPRCCPTAPMAETTVREFTG